MIRRHPLLLSIFTSVRLIAACCVLFGAVYPLTVLFAGNVVSPSTVNGSLVYDSNGKIIGSKLIAQSFTKPEWFWPRPSAVEYNATASGGSNLAPGNPKLAERIGKTIENHRAAGDEITADHPLPLDLALASACGLDPDISVDAALFQAPRVANSRKIPVEKVNRLIESQGSGKLSHVLTGAQPTVNILKLNLALAGIKTH